MRPLQTPPTSTLTHSPRSLPASGEVGNADGSSSLVPIDLSPTPALQKTASTGKLSQEADRVLKDIDRQMQSLPADEAKQLKAQFATLVDASTCIIDREQFDPANLTTRDRQRLRDAANALRQQVPITDIASKKASAQQHSPTFRGIQNTLQQMSRQIGAELRAILREAARAEHSEQIQAPPVFNAEGLQALHDGIHHPNAGNPAKSYVSTLLACRHLAQSIFSDIEKDMLVPGLGHGNAAMIQRRHADLQQHLSALTDPSGKQAAFGSMTEAQRQLVNQMIDGFSELERKLQLSIDLHTDYASPDSVEQICHAKQVDIHAAIRVLQNDPSGGHSELIGYLEHRWQALEDLKLAPGNVDVAKLLGKKAIHGIGQIKHPIDAARQSLNLEKAVNKIWAALSSDAVLNVTSMLELDGFDEPMLMRALLKKAGISDATDLHRRAHRAVLDSQSWQIIRSDIVVPFGTQANPQLKQVESIATPASHVLANPERVAHASSNAVLNPSRAAEYLHKGTDGKEVRGGFISHDLAESNHALMACHDELRIDGQVIFGATRHGVNAPFGLPAELKAMDQHEAGALIVALIGPTQRPPTVESIRYPNTSNSPTSIAPTNTTLLDNTIHRAFRAQLRQHLDHEQVLQQSLVHAGLLTSTSDTTQASVDDLLGKSEHAAELAARVQKDPELMKLLVRQGALNRAREVIIMEIARNPDLGDKIANNQTLLFSSISLLTPDHLRHFVASISDGNASFDEKSMLEIQVQAYKDLQQEIQDDGLMINGQKVQAKILAFNWGVSETSLLKPGNDPVIGSLINGHAVSNDLCNEQSLNDLVGLPDDSGAFNTENETDRFVADANNRLTQLEAQPTSDKIQAEIKRLKDAINVVTQLQEQIRQIWSDGSYRTGGNEPYKMPARIALLTHYLSGGTLFNCKSGKDRTGQLSVEAKALALRIAANDGTVPKPDQKLTPIEQIQYGALTFVDKTRSELQRYATGYAGSKLSYARRLLNNLFALTDGLTGRAREQLNRERFREFMGLSKRTKS